MYKSKDSKTIFNKNKDPEVVPIESQQQHKG